MRLRRRTLRDGASEADFWKHMSEIESPSVIRKYSSPGQEEMDNANSGATATKLSNNPAQIIPF